MTLHLPDGREVRLGTRTLGRGAEGLVRELADTEDLCAKLYLDPAPDLHQRLVALMRTEPATWPGDHGEHLHVAWPRQALLDDGGHTVGFLMPRVEGRSLTRLFDPYVRAEAIDEPTWRVLVAVAARVARLLGRLHQAGIVVGDVSPANIMVSRTGHVTLIDCDTVQFTDPTTGLRYSCAKVTPEYAPPTLAGAGPSALTPADDAFGLAILICQLLMEGDHPFEGVPADPAEADALAQDNIRLRNNRIVTPQRFVPLPGTIPPRVLPPQVMALAHTCFGEGHLHPEARPLSDDWEKALEHAGFELMGCRVNPRHLFHSSLPGCVWCARIAQGFDDRYPAAFVAPRVVAPPAAPRSAKVVQRTDGALAALRRRPVLAISVVLAVLLLLMVLAAVLR
jgi:DNA-binding helix-hairpin-helix protein with protein kinase domain